jgi:hypothetical protein
MRIQLDNLPTEMTPLDDSDGNHRLLLVDEAVVTLRTIRPVIPAVSVAEGRMGVETEGCSYEND